MDRYPRQRVSHKAKSAAVVSLSSYRWLMERFRHKKLDHLVNALAHLASEGQDVGARDTRDTKPGGVVGTTKMARKKKEPEEGPETLLWIAGRARTLAHAVSEPDKSRILAYVKKLEAQAAAMMTPGGGLDAPKQKRRRQAKKKSARSATAAGPKKKSRK